MSTISLISEWHREALGSDIGLRSPRLVMGCPLWGEDFVNNYLKFSLPSILASSLEPIEIVLFVDGLAEQRLKDLPYPIQLRRLPEPIMQGIYEEPGYRYFLLAAVHNLLINQAAKVGAGFHMTCPDAIYSQGYFDRVLALAEKHEAIVQLALTMEKHAGERALNDLRGSHVIMRASAADLGRIGFEHMNPVYKSFTMDGITDFTMMPNSHFIWWRGKSTVRLHSAHANTIWISPKRCRMAGTAVGGTIDSELPRYVSGDFYAPTIADELVCVSTAEAGPPIDRVPFYYYREEFWKFIGDNRAFLPFFQAPCVAPVPFDDSAPDDAELDRRMATLMELLEQK